MSKTLQTVLMLFLASFFGYSQAELTVTAPSASGATSGLRSPNGTTAHTTFRGVIIIPASELTGIPAGTTITKLSLLLSSVGSGPAGGTMTYFLENTADATNLKPTDWASIIAPMTSVYTGAFTLPAVAGSTGELSLTSAFVYTGGSLYVGYDYLGTTFSTTAYIYSANNLLPGGWRGLASATTTPPASLTGTSGFRPSFRFSFANPFTNELNVSGLAGEKGIFNNTLKTTQTVTSFVTNTSAGTLTNVPVTLTVTGANPYTTTQTIPSINSGETVNVLFLNVPTANLGAQTLTVSIPADENNTNNSRTFNQDIQCNKIAYNQSAVQSGGVGFNTGTGVIAVRHDIPNNIQTFVKTVSNHFPTAASITGNTIKGLLFNGSGVKIDSTALITITAGMLGTKQDFNFINGAVNVAGQTVYVGFRQTANPGAGYFPFANQNNSYVDPLAAATFPLNGGVPAPLGSTLGYMMIEAEFDYGGFDVANSSFSGVLCPNSPLNITPTPGYSNYEFFIDGNSVQNGPLATYTTGPLTANTTISVNITNGACALVGNVMNINVQLPSAPTASAQNFPFGATVAQLVATGDNLAWYTVDTAGIALTSSLPLMTGTYYVSQTVNGCESLRTAVSVVVGNPVLTRVRISQCGLILRANNSSNVINAIPVPGATGYDFEVTVNGGTPEVISTSNSFFNFGQLSSLPGLSSIIGVRVRALIAGVPQAYGVSCNVFTVTQITQMRFSQCGITVPANESSVVINAIPVASATSYDFEVTVNGGAPQLINTANSFFNFGMLSALPAANSTLSIRVRATANTIVGAWGNACTVNTPASSPSDEDFTAVVTNQSIAAYPNPFSNQFTLKLANNSEATIQVFDINGKMISNQEVKAIYEVELGHNLEAGVYLVRVEQGDETKSIKMIKK